MMIEFTIAAALAAVFSLFGGKIEHPRAPYWRRWDPAALRIWIRLPMFVIYACAAIAVTAIANWQEEIALPNRHWLAGGLYGVITILGMRPDAIAGRSEAQVARAIADLSAGRAILRAVVDASAERVEEAVQRAVPRTVGDLSTQQLVVLSLRLYRRYYGRLTDPRSRKKVLQRLRQAGRVARAERDESDPFGDDALLAIEDLRGFVESQIVDHGDWTIAIPADVPPAVKTA